MLKERIAKDYMKAFKERNQEVKKILSVVKGEIQTIEKNKGIDNLPDEEVIKILTKTAKSLKEMVKSGDKEAKSELDIIESYLPKQMSEDEIKNKIKDLVDSGINNIGSIMKEFSKLPADKKLVANIFNNL